MTQLNYSLPSPPVCNMFVCLYLPQVVYDPFHSAQVYKIVCIEHGYIFNYYLSSVICYASEPSAVFIHVTAEHK